MALSPFLLSWLLHTPRFPFVESAALLQFARVGELEYQRTETSNGFAAPPRNRKELRDLYSRVVKKIAAMSPEQRLATMVSAGIYTKSGKLTKKYGG